MLQVQSFIFYILGFRKKKKKSEVQRGFRLKRQAWMAERSKALDSSSSLFGGVGSNPIPSSFCFTFESDAASGCCR